jgi:N-formylglutamate amidohydrolase
MTGQQSAPFTVFNAESPSLPILLSVPHAGRDYPPELIANLRVPPVELLRLEDRYADRLAQSAIASGFPAIVAHRARAWIDLNRAETDIDTQMLAGPQYGRVVIPSAKARGGLGLIPRRLQSCGELWRGPLRHDDVECRIAGVHRPYHQSVTTILAAMRARFGVAILLDVHSMPPIQSRFGGDGADERPPQIVLGDRFGRSAASIHAELVMAHARERGFEVALNHPYSGDFILSLHGNPAQGVHALQLEIDRSLYLDSALREPSRSIGAMTQLVHDAASLLAEQALGSGFAEAAE